MTNCNDKRLSRGFWALVSMVAAYLCFWMIPSIFGSLNAKTVDRLFLFRSQTESLRPSYDETIVHVDLNDSSIQKLDNFYLNRAHYAQLVRNLSGMDVDAQLFDYIFPARSTDKEDRLLIDAVIGAENVYFGMAFELRKGDTENSAAPKPPVNKDYLERTRWKIPVKASLKTLYTGENPILTFSALAEASRGIGFLSVKPDPDGVFRRIPLLVRYRDALYPSFSLKAVCDYLQVPPEKIDIVPGKQIRLKDADNPAAEAIQDIVIPIDLHGNMIVNFLGPWGSMKHYRFADVFRAGKKPEDMALWADELAEKIVVISDVSTGSADIGPVPTDTNFPLSGLHSNAINTILTGAFLKELSPLLMLGIELLLMLAVVGLSLRFSPVAFSLTTGAVAAVYFGSAASLFLFSDVIVNIVRPLLMIFFAFAAIQIITALENARMFAVAEKAKEIAEYDLEIGRRIQAGFFPDVLPKPPGFELSAYFKAARQVAGDFYDIFLPVQNGPVAIVVADVCDKGVGAALFMALIRSLLRSSTIQFFEKKTVNPDSLPSQSQEALKTVVSRVNNYLDETHGEANMFATLFFGLLDPATGMLYYINAGHEKPVIVDRKGLKAELGTCGPAVGAFPDVEYKTAAIELEPGDLCFVFTDGVTDAKNPSGAFFTKENLISLLIQPFDTAEEMVDRIKRNLHSHISDAEQFDDITMVMFHRSRHTDGSGDAPLHEAIQTDTT
jgi:phosphoserine phosphatase RsbU/P